MEIESLMASNSKMGKFFGIIKHHRDEFYTYVSYSIRIHPISTIESITRLPYYILTFLVSLFCSVNTFTVAPQCITST